MSHLNIIRAWKDEEYRLSLSEEQRALLPEHPAGLIELNDADLNQAAGGISSPHPCCSIGPRCPYADYALDCTFE
ncbi:MAG: mersacidin/lichenicidin family type 2 lantibiotic [Pyrinomonadaceae bacterium]|nr:mersacidin/lichenicidin family type 2 lantibiotic [Pyrinomonadaceae bacterium]